MTIQSTIKEIGLFDLFQILHLHRKTGRLIIKGATDKREAKVVFKEGAVVLASIYKNTPKSIEELLRCRILREAREKNEEIQEPD